MSRTFETRDGAIHWDTCAIAVDSEAVCNCGSPGPQPDSGADEPPEPEDLTLDDEDFDSSDPFATPDEPDDPDAQPVPDDFNLDD